MPISQGFPRFIRRYRRISADRYLRYTSVIIIQIHPDHSGYRGFHGNTGSLLLYTALSDALVCHLRYDTGSSSGSAGFQPVHRHLLPWNDASYRAGICQLAHKGRMLHEEAICCLWHMFLHKGQMVHRERFKFCVNRKN